MFIIHGTRRTERKLGNVANFCPICRDIRIFRLLRIGLASHLYYISFGSGKLTGYVIECTDCGVDLTTDPTQYGTPDTQRITDVESVVRNTYPRVREVHAERLTLEKKIKQSSNSLTSSQRESLLLEPFKLLNPRVEERFKGSTQFDKPASIGCFGTILVSVALFVIAVNLREPLQGQVMGVGGILAGVGVVYTLIQLGFAPRRYLKRTIVPMLVRALHPLGATQAELTACLQKCKTLGMTIGQKLKAEVLWGEVQGFKGSR